MPTVKHRLGALEQRLSSYEDARVRAFQDCRRYLRGHPDAPPIEALDQNLRATLAALERAMRDQSVGLDAEAFEGHDLIRDLPAPVPRSSIHPGDVTDPDGEVPGR